MRSGPISETFAGVFATPATNLYSSSGTLRLSLSRDFTGRRCEIAVPFSCNRHLPAPQRGAALHAPRIGLNRAGAGIEAFDRSAKAVLEIQPAHLAVADHVEADALLQLHRGAHRLVLDCTQRRGVELALIERLRASITAAGRNRLPTTSVRIDRRSIMATPTVALDRGSPCRGRRGPRPVRAPAAPATAATRDRSAP